MSCCSASDNMAAAEGVAALRSSLAVEWDAIVQPTDIPPCDSAYSVQVTGSLNVQEKKWCTLYLIEVTAKSGRKWHIYKRYKEILAQHRLYATVSREIPGIPPKRWSKLDPAVIEERKKVFGQYFSGLLAPASRNLKLRVLLEAFLEVSKLWVHARDGDRQMLSYLLAQQVGGKAVYDLSCADRAGGTALHYAAAFSHVEIVALLLGVVNMAPQPADKAGYTPLALAGAAEIRTRPQIQHILREAGAEEVVISPNHPIPFQYRKLPSERRFLCIVNPYSGTGRALRHVEHLIKPIFEHAGIQMEIQETEAPLHAKQIGKTLELEKYDTLLCVSGDGVLWEAVNGLMEHDDPAARNMPIAIIPGGTGNGLAWTLDFSSALDAIRRIIKGVYKPLDLMQVEQPDEPTNYAFLLVGWSILSAVDFNSEKFRWMGDARFTMQGIWEIITAKNYCSRIFTKQLDAGTVAPPRVVEQGDDDEKALVLHSQPAEPPVLYRSAADGVQEQWWCQENPTAPAGWDEVDGQSKLFYATNVPRIAKDFWGSKHADEGNGMMDIVLVQTCGRVNGIKVLLKFENGSHTDMPCCRTFKTQELVFLPSTHHQLPIDVDGERAPTKPTRVKMVPQALSVAC